VLFFKIEEIKTRNFGTLLARFVLTAQTKTIERDWNWRPTAGLAPDIYAAHCLGRKRYIVHLRKSSNAIFYTKTSRKTYGNGLILLLSSFKMHGAFLQYLNVLSVCFSPPYWMTNASHPRWRRKQWCIFIVFIELKTVRFCLNSPDTTPNRLLTCFLRFRCRNSLWRIFLQCIF
jgi:hypothetical protein